MNYISIVLFIVSIFLIKFLRLRVVIGIASVLSFVYIVFLICEFSLQIFTGNTFMPFTINLLKISIEGAPIEPFAKDIAIGICMVASSALFCVIIYKRSSTAAKNLPRNKNRVRIGAVFFAVCFTAAFVLNPLTRSAWEVKNAFYPSVKRLKQDIYPLIALPKFNAPKKRKNIVYIYLESLNSGYMDEKLFPDLMPNINALSPRLEFDNIHQNPGAAITIEGFFASNCAMPYIYNFDDQNKNIFYKNITCASDILHELGYHTYFMKGASLKFQKTDEYFKAHHFDEMKGLADIDLKANKTVWDGGWGVNDDDMFDIAWEDFTRLSKSGQPFLQSMITLSTHAPDGIIPKACENMEYNFQGNSVRMLRAVKCTDMLVGNFIKKIRSSEFAKNTLIVIQNDHVVPYIQSSKETYDALIHSSKGGGMLFMMIDDDFEGVKIINSMGSSLDTFVTVLGYLGITNELNLGRSVIGSKSLYGSDMRIYSKAAALLRHLKYDEIKQKRSQ